MKQNTKGKERSNLVSGFSVKAGVHLDFIENVRGLKEG